MIQTNLVLIDGIAGTGKTTLSRKLHGLIGEKYGNAILYPEFMASHPVHEWEAQDYPTWYRQTIDNWRELSRMLVQSHAIGIMESSLFQGTVGDLLERNIGQDIILDYARQVPFLIEKTSPVLIYLIPGDIRSHIERTYAQRPERWQTKIDSFIQKTAFGRARGLSALEGYITFIEELKRISDELFQLYDLRKVRINVTRSGWDDCARRITEFLDIPGTPSQ